MSSTSATTLVLSGGGVKGFLTLGVLSVLDRVGKLTPITSIIGTSVGSLIGLLLIGGVTPLEIFENLYTRPSLLPGSEGALTRMETLRRAWHTSLSAFDDWGFLDIRTLTLPVEEMLATARLRPTNPFFGMTESPTFFEVFERTGKKLTIIATNLSLRRAETFSVETSPHLRCLDAARMSSSIPIIFKSLRYRGNFYADGALLTNFPIEYVEPGTSYIGVLIATDVGNEIDSFLDYINRIVSLPLWAENEKKALATSPLACHIVVRFPISGVDFSPSVESRIRMFARGAEEAEAVLAPRPSPGGGAGEIEGIVDHPPSES